MVLSGDNAVMIAMACKNGPQNKGNYFNFTSHTKLDQIPAYLPF